MALEKSFVDSDDVVDVRNDDGNAVSDWRDISEWLTLGENAMAILVLAQAVNRLAHKVEMLCNSNDCGTSEMGHALEGVADAIRSHADFSKSSQG
jgi:hypothetical protein